MSRELGPREREELRILLAHDLKTPLTVIAGYAELLRLRPHDEKTREEAPRRIVDAAQQAAREIDAIVERFLGSAEPAYEPAPAAAREPRPLQPRGSVFRILLVDDDEGLRRLLRLTLPEDEFHVFEAGDVEEALTLVRREQPHLVVLDWQLRRGSGADVLAALPAGPERPRVVVLTADRTASPSGADAFLVKPFSPVELLDVLGALVGDGDGAAGRSPGPA